MHATSTTYASSETPTCEVPSNGVVEISLLPVVLVTLRFRLYRSSYREVVSTLHCALENGADLHVNERKKIRHYRVRSTEERRRIRRKKECQIAIFYFARCVRKLRYYSDVIHSFDWKSGIEHDGDV